MTALDRLVEADAVTRLRDRDPTLFTIEVDQRIPIQRRLGWTDLAEKAPGRMPLLHQLRDAIIDEGATDIVLLGMGGSSLAPLVLERVFGSAPGLPRLHVVDTTDPGTAEDLMSSLSPESTFFLVSSKSGTTIEPLSLYAVFRPWSEAALGRVRAGKHFMVVTDPDSPLDKLRQKELMRTTLSAPPTVGGRYSALSMFGLAPAALIGVDLEALIARAQAMETACWLPEAESPGALLAAWIGDAYESGRNKLTLACSEPLRPFGLWVEQLVAESTGKQGRGIVPVLEDSPTTPTGYGDDRAVVTVRLADDAALAEWSAAVSDGCPAYEIVLADALDLGAEFVRWEVAVALTGMLIGVNPFDEPNVTEAKQATEALLAGGLPVPSAALDYDGAWVTLAGRLASPAVAPPTLAEAVAPLLSSANPRDYLAVLAFLPEDDDVFGPVREAVATWSKRTGIAAVVELGPRYLHSTGQLHKGGPDEGVFLIVTARGRVDVAVPGKPFGLASLFRAQAEGDLATLASHEKRVARIDLPDPSAASAERVAKAVRDATPS